MDKDGRLHVDSLFIEKCFQPVNLIRIGDLAEFEKRFLSI